MKRFLNFWPTIVSLLVLVLVFVLELGATSSYDRAFELASVTLGVWLLGLASKK